MTNSEIRGYECVFACTGTLDELSLKRQFHQGTNGGDLGGDHWDSHGKHFLESKVAWEIGTGQQSLRLLDREINIPKPKNTFPPHTISARKELLEKAVSKAQSQLSDRSFRRLLADRDIQPEIESKALDLESNGKGATNIIRRHQNSTNLPRELIQVELLEALNLVFGKDGQFTEIIVRQHDEQKTTAFPEGHYEIFLVQKKKGLVELSRSGSGLKTLFLVLLNLLVVPKIDNKSKGQYVFAFEELENNLHPALLRRLLRYLEDYAMREKAVIFLTTHSSVALDIFSLSPNAQIIHVTHDGESAKATTVSAHFDHLGVISELGAKPSDLLQANGIIWVEGPSDCIYVNRWIYLVSGGELREGRDYLCAFYGGALLARTQFAAPEEQVTELINLFRVNPNIIVICDGDRTSDIGDESILKGRVTRIKAELEKIPGARLWITGAKEIENYLPGEVLAQALEKSNLPDPGQFERFFPGKEKESYAVTHLELKGLDKMDLALRASPFLTIENMQRRFDWATETTEIVETVRLWNA